MTLRIKTTPVKAGPTIFKRYQYSGHHVVVKKNLPVGKSLGDM
jgi:hypothetical protein